MTTADDPTVLEYERLAQEAEHSPLLPLLKIGRALVWVFYALALVTAILLTTAFFLRLFGANPDAGFVQWVYRSTEHAMRPFRGIFPPRDVGGSSVLDLSYLFAAVFYFVIALLVDGLHRWLTVRLRRQQRSASEARAYADYAAQQAVAQQRAADLSAQQAAAQEYAARQAAEQQYAIARAAAQEVLAHQRPASDPPGVASVVERDPGGGQPS